MNNINIWQIIGFLLASYSVVANDSLQTLGTYLSSNRNRTPKVIQIIFICSLTIGVLLIGWSQHQISGGYGDPSWGRLEQFPAPEQFKWFYILPPIAVLILTQFGVPVSTTFLVLTTFTFENSWALLFSSLSGYGIAFFLSLTIYGFARWLVLTNSDQSSRQENESSTIWYLIQWLSTGWLWSQWLVQDLANIFIYLPRQMNLVWMLIATGVLCVGLCILVATGGGPIQGIVNNKINTADLRSASAIDLLFGFLLFLAAKLSTLPLSTTCIFLGLLAGREIALRVGLEHDQSIPLVNLLVPDLLKLAIGILVSLLIAIALQPLIQFTG
ncbi:MAG: hypothetical protein AB8E74_09270 [Prochlorococcus sp.]